MKNEAEVLTDHETDESETDDSKSDHVEECSDYGSPVFERSPSPHSLENEDAKDMDTEDAWQARRLVVDKLDLNLQDELDYVGELAKNNTSNHLKWHHRRCISERIGTNDAAIKKLEYTDDILSKDTNNYCAWSHRKWVVEKLGQGWEDELTYCSKILEKDNFNSRAWNQRCFVVTKSPIHGGLKAMRDRELNYALTAIEADPGNECAWKYLRLLFKGDMQSLVRNLSVEGTIVSVLISERDRVDFLDGKDEDAPTIKRGVVYALEMVLDLLKHGHEPSNALIDVTDALCPDSCPPDAGFDDKVVSILQATDEIWIGF